MNKTHMQSAINEAITNIDKGGGPFGALIVKDEKIISLCGNRVTLNNDPTAHAEVLAIREAAKILGRWDLSDCELYTSCEPCPMCLGAVYWAHIPVIYYGATRIDAKNAGFDDTFIYDEIALLPEKRKIKMQNILREKAVEGFEKWINFPGKARY
jgi:tRNA(Arg) A34 adenosine deaminase TadA